MSRPRRTYCAVYCCQNSNVNRPELSFFRLPLDAERRSKWLDLIAREDLGDKSSHTSCVCEDHFAPKDILPGSFRKMLKTSALPSLLLPSSKTNEVTALPSQAFVDEFTQTEYKVLRNDDDDTGIPSELSWLKRMESEPLEDNQQIKTEPGIETESFHELCDKYLKKELSELVKRSSRLIFNYRGRGYEQNQQYKNFCFSLYLSSPQTYRLLHNVIHLPSPASLNKPGMPGLIAINDRLMTILKLKTEAMTDNEKNCSVVVGTMKLSTGLFYDIKQDKIIGFQEVDGVQTQDPAEEVLVVMARGIFSNWKQPVGLALLCEGTNNDDVNRWIDKLLIKLFATGLNIRTFVSDITSYLFSTAKKRSVTAEQPYFFVKNRKVYYVFDAPHLMKEMRDNLISYDFEFQEYVAKYDHIIQFFEHDKHRNIKIAHKLTDSHVYPTDDEKMEVKYALHLFSNTVATGISTYVDFNVIPDSGRETAKFVKDMNDLFDALNASNRKESRRKFCNETSPITFLNKMFQFFSQNGDEESNITFIQGFQITISSILMLMEDLKSEGYTFLATRNLNKEVLDILYTRMRTKGGLSFKPTSRQFISVFRKLFTSDIITPQKAAGGDDLRELLTQFNKLAEISDHMEESFVEEKPVIGIKFEEPEGFIRIKRSDYNQLHLPTKKSFLKFCNLLMEKCSEHHSECLVLETYIKNCKEYSEDTNDIVKVMPSYDFVQNIKKFDEIFCNCFRRSLNGKIAQFMYEEMENISLVWPCACFPAIYLKKLFIRMRIFFSVKFNNRALRRQGHFSLNVL